MATEGRNVWIAWEYDADDEASLELLDNLADGLRNAHIVEIVLPAPPDG